MSFLFWRISAFFCRQLSELALKERPDVLLISGDLYDRSVPSAEAVSVLDAFLSHVTLELKIPVLAIAGNHDSPQRLDFAAAFCALQACTFPAGIKDIGIKLRSKTNLDRPFLSVSLFGNQRWFVQIFLTRKSTLLMMRQHHFTGKPVSNVSHSGMSSWLTVFFLI